MVIFHSYVKLPEGNTPKWQVFYRDRDDEPTGGPKVKVKHLIWAVWILSVKKHGKREVMSCDKIIHS